MDGFKIAEAYVNITGRNMMAEALNAAVGQIRSVGAEAESVGAKSSATGLLGSKAFLAIGAAAAGGAIAVVKMAADFESSTNRLVTSAGESQSNIKLIRDGILSMAGAVGYSAEELSAAMYKVESGGQHGADALLVLKSAAQGAKEENANLTTVTDAVTSALQDYHLKASDSATVTSKLVAATSQGKMTFEELAGSLNAILPIASANHISLNEILGDLASMTVHGISAEQATQNIANAVRNLAAPNTIAAKEMALLGLNATDLSLKLGERGLSGTIQLIAGAIQKNMGPDSTAVVLNLTNAMKGLPPSVQSIAQQVVNGTITLVDYHKELAKLGPITASQAQSFTTLADSTHKIGTESLSGSQIIQSYTQAMGKAMGGATGLNVALMLTGENSGTTANAIKTVTDATAQADGNTRGWSEIQNTLNQKLAEAKDGLGAFAIEIGTYFLPIVSKGAEALAIGTSWLSKHKDAAIIGASIIGGVLVASFVALGVAIWTAIAPFVPLGLAITGVIAVGVLLVSHWGDVKRIAGDVFGFIGSFITGIWNTVSRVTTAVWDAITNYFTRLFNAHRQLIYETFGPILIYIQNAWNTVSNITTAIWNGISGFLSFIWRNIHDNVVGVWNAIVNFLAPGLNYLQGIWSGAWNNISNVFGNVWGRVTGIAQAIWGNITGAFRDGVNNVIGIINRLVDGADTVLRFLLIPVIPHIPGLASGGVLGLAGGGTVGAGFQTNGPRAIVGEGNPNHPEYVIPTDPSHRNNALALYQSLGAKLMAGGGIIDWIGSTVSKAEQWMGAGATGIMNNAVSDLSGGIPEPFRDMAVGVGHKVVDAIKGLIDKAQQTFSAAFSGSPDLGGWIQAALGLTGTPQSWAGPLSVLIGRESGGNPNAINLTDSNAQAGYPSQGLMQTIPQTFAAYHQSGTSGNIRDPIANIAAGINYIKARYGSIFNVQQANPNLPARGYDSGGLLPTGFSSVINNTGRPERVLDASQTAKLDSWLANPGSARPITINVTQIAGSPQETGRFVALALRTVS